MSQREPLIRKIDCIQIQVPDLEAGLAFYRDQLGHQLVWRSEQAVGLSLPDSDAEIVLQLDRPGVEVNLMVATVDLAVARIVDAGGSVVVPPFDIQIGRCVVVQDPWGTHLILLDSSKGLLETDADGNILGNLAPSRKPATQ